MNFYIKTIYDVYNQLWKFMTKHLKKAGGHIGRNVVEITIKMKTIFRKNLMIKSTFIGYSMS